jgi:hypothetical protein
MAAPDAAPPVVELPTCSGEWKTLRTDAPFPAPNALAFGAGRIAFSTESQADQDPPSTIRALSLNAGAEEILAAEYAFDLWAERDFFVYSAVRQLRSLPVVGGSSTLLLDFADRTELGTFSRVQALDPWFLYWMNLADHGVWRISRFGGELQRLSAPTKGLLTGIALSPDAVVVADSSTAFAIPLDRVDVRRLADTGGAFAGVDASGACFWRLRPSGRDFINRYELVRAPSNGGALETIWADPPGNLLPARAWADGRGGWIVATSGSFDDGKRHASVWFVSSTGEARLAACDPRGDEQIARIEARPALTDDAVYLVAEYVQKGPASWTIVEIER